MTAVLLYLTQDGQPLGFKVEGHALYADSGQDIVCAALSFLSITCANALESIAKAKPKVRVGDGLLDVRLEHSQLNDRTDTILSLFRRGMEDLQDSYEENITLSTKEIS